jgi:cytidylate kinase
LTRLSVVISGPPAVGKTSLARSLAASLGMRAVGGGEVLIEVARGMGYRVHRPEGWWDTPEGMMFLRRRAQDPEIDRAVDRRLIAMVREGGVVVTSYPIPWLTDAGIKVWLKGSLEVRARRMAKRDNIAVEEARRIIEARDRANAELYRSIYGIGFGVDLSVFDLVVNTDPLDEAGVFRTVESYVRGWLGP